MSKNMHIEGIKYPSSKEVRNNSRRSVSFIRPVQFIWVAVIVGLWVAASHYGTPHLRLSYSYSGNQSHPIYHSCRYVGFKSRIIRPHDGRCPLFRLFK